MCGAFFSQQCFLDFCFCLMGPEAPRVAAVKKLNLVYRGKCQGFFVNFFFGHFPWKLKDENLRKISPKFRRIFRRSLRKISQELRSGGLRAQFKAVAGSASNRKLAGYCEGVLHFPVTGRQICRVQAASCQKGGLEVTGR